MMSTVLIKFLEMVLKVVQYVRLVLGSTTSNAGAMIVDRFSALHETRAYSIGYYKSPIPIPGIPQIIGKSTVSKTYAGSFNSIPIEIEYVKNTTGLPMIYTNVVHIVMYFNQVKVKVVGYSGGRYKRYTRRGENFIELLLNVDGAKVFPVLHSISDREQVGGQYSPKSTITGFTRDGTDKVRVTIKLDSSIKSVSSDLLILYRYDPIS